MIRALAVSLSGSEHIVTGGVRDKQSYQWKTEEEAREHLTRIGWTRQRFEVDSVTNEQGLVRTTWDDQSVTEHMPGSGTIVYLRGGPEGRKISKSDPLTLRNTTPKLDSVRVHDALIDKDPVGVKRGKTK